MGKKNSIARGEGAPLSALRSTARARCGALLSPAGGRAGRRAKERGGGGCVQKFVWTASENWYGRRSEIGMDGPYRFLNAVHTEFWPAVHTILWPQLPPPFLLRAVPDPERRGGRARPPSPRVGRRAPPAQRGGRRTRAQCGGGGVCQNRSERVC